MQLRPHWSLPESCLQEYLRSWTRFQGEGTGHCGPGRQERCCESFSPEHGSVAQLLPGGDTHCHPPRGCQLDSSLLPWTSSWRKNTNPAAFPALWGPPNQQVGWANEQEGPEPTTALSLVIPVVQVCLAPGARPIGAWAPGTDPPFTRSNTDPPPAPSTDPHLLPALTPTYARHLVPRTGCLLTPLPLPCAVTQLLSRS